jgi:hypothetical protein
MHARDDACSNVCHSGEAVHIGCKVGCIGVGISMTSIKYGAGVLRQ